MKQQKSTESLIEVAVKSNNSVSVEDLIPTLEEAGITDPRVIARDILLGKVANKDLIDELQEIEGVNIAEEFPKRRLITPATRKTM